MLRGRGKGEGSETEDEPETFINLGTKKSHMFIADWTVHESEFKTIRQRYNRCIETRH